MAEHIPDPRRIAFVKLNTDGTAELDLFLIYEGDDLVDTLVQRFSNRPDSSFWFGEVKEHDSDALAVYKVLLLCSEFYIDDAQARRKANELSKLWTWLQPDTARSYDTLYKKPIGILRSPVRSALNVELVVYCQKYN